MTDGRIFPQEAAAAMLALRGWTITPPEHSGWTPPSWDHDHKPTLLDTQALNWLKNAGWQAEPPPPGWQAAFTPQFYEAAGDEEGQVYARVDLPEGLYYAFQDAARKGLESMKARRDRFQSIESSVANAERSPTTYGPDRSFGIMDDITLSSSEIRGIVAHLSAQITQWEKALDRADTRKHR